MAREHARGRTDAKAGIYRTRGATKMYRQGYRDESGWMVERGEHPQCILPLPLVQNGLTEMPETG